MSIGKKLIIVLAIAAGGAGCQEERSILVGSFTTVEGKKELVFMQPDGSCTIYYRVRIDVPETRALGCRAIKPAGG